MRNMFELSGPATGPGRPDRRSIRGSSLRSQRYRPRYPSQHRKREAIEDFSAEQLASPQIDSVLGPGAETQRPSHSFGPAAFETNLSARIFRPCRSVTTSRKAGTKDWRLVFERRRAPFIDSLMGWTGSDEPMTQVELKFPTLEAATAYCERQGLNYAIQWPHDAKPKGWGRRSVEEHTRSDIAVEFTGPGTPAKADDRVQKGPQVSGEWDSPFGVVGDHRLTLEEKRAILRDWAWTEYLIDRATDEGMPENGRPSRLDEAELALLSLDAGRPGSKGSDRRLQTFS